MNSSMDEAYDQDTREFQRRYDEAGGKLIAPRTLGEAIQITGTERVGHYLQAHLDGREEDAARLLSYITEIASRR